MKVNIEHSERVIGLIWKKTEYVVTVDVGFNEQELALLDTKEQRTMAVVDAGPVAGSHVNLHSPILLFWLFKKPLVRPFPTVIAAREFENLMLGSLSNVSDWVKGNTEDFEKSSTYEI